MNIRRHLFRTTVVYLFLFILLTPTLNYANSADWDSLKDHTFDSSTKAVLTIGGKLRGKERVRFDLDKLTQLPFLSFNLTHPVTGEKSQYTGILLKDFLSNLGISPEATHLIIRASNDYKSAVKIDDINRYEYLLSYKKNNKLYDELPADQNKGPLAIVINFDKHPELDYDIYKHQLVWFVERITVK